MTPEEQRIAIAREMDFYLIEDEHKSGAVALRHGRTSHRYAWCDSTEEAWTYAPDYLNDLNAMYEVEGYFDDKPTDLKSLYYDYIMISVGWDFNAKNASELRWQLNWKILRATAQQRAEAFLRTVGKWSGE